MTTKIRTNLILVESSRNLIDNMCKKIYSNLITWGDESRLEIRNSRRFKKRSIWTRCLSVYLVGSSYLSVDLGILRVFPCVLGLFNFILAFIWRLDKNLHFSPISKNLYLKFITNFFGPDFGEIRTQKFLKGGEYIINYLHHNSHEKNIQQNFTYLLKTFFFWYAQSNIYVTQYVYYKAFTLFQHWFKTNMVHHFT